MKLLSRLDVNPLGDRQHRLGKAAKVSMQREKVAKEKAIALQGAAQTLRELIDGEAAPVVEPEVVTPEAE